MAAMHSKLLLKPWEGLEGWLSCLECPLLFQEFGSQHPCLVANKGL